VGAVNDGVAVHSIVVLEVLPIIGGVLSTLRVVAGDSLHAATELELPDGVVPQSELVT
jgi:hypothetical protein